jgi:hypothetical protein
MNEEEQKPVVTESPRIPETEKQTTETGGAAMLRQAVDMVLQDKSMDIALALAKSSVEGHIQSTKFMYDLADEQAKLGTMEIAAKLRSLASEWATEPLWLGESSEEVAETAGGSHEPEG